MRSHPLASRCTRQHLNFAAAPSEQILDAGAVVFDEPIVTDVDLGRHRVLTMRRDGGWRHQGHFRARTIPMDPGIGL
jgi:hypothetical protein